MKKTNYTEWSHKTIDKHRNTPHTLLFHHRHITQADWSQQWTDTLKSLPSGQIITDELRCTPLLLWASRLGYRARGRNKHTRSNFLFVELWSQTHQQIQSRKVFYNACSVAMLSACMLMFCSSAQWSSCSWSVRRRRELSFTWWALQFYLESRSGSAPCSASSTRQHLSASVYRTSISASSTLPMQVAVACLSK